MVESLNRIVLTLLEATVTLYPANPDGSPMTSSPLWTGVKAERIELHERWEGVQTRPTGIQFPKRHNLVQGYELSIGRVWALPLTQLDGFTPGRNDRYVLDLLWKDEDAYPEGGNQWHRRTLYGVTMGERTIESRDIDNGHTETQMFEAESMAVSSGTGTVPALPADSAPYTVAYVAANQSVDLYSYDPTTQAFTSLTDPSTMAVIAYASGALTMTFAGADAPALTVTNTGELQVTAIEPGVPDRSMVPRLDFYYGQNRLWSLSANGAMISRAAIEGIPADGKGQYNLLGNSLLAVTHTKLGTTGQNLHAFNPAEITGLKLWVEAEGIKNAQDGDQVTVWPDKSGNANDLTGGTGAIYRSHVRGKPAVEFSEQWPGPVSGQAFALFMRTSTPILIPDNSVVFVVGALERLNAFNGGDFVGAVGGSESDPGDIMVGSEQGKLTGLYVSDNGAGGGNNDQAIGQTIAMDNFGLFEVEVTSSNVIARKNGVQEASTALTGTQPGQQRTIVVGSRNGATGFLNGYVRAVLVYQGTLTLAQKAKVRQYLNHKYRVY